ncbi:hypothetical protein Q3A66_02195 [Hymenobacter sp. BT770]|uniref:hypothetical protein n=1 Tax=Hymenobacter sp. BT770 TaxID=2886942 RepID=UPI001D126CCE|nr:hypothetical protein [Hymenobacter sp. BT770]MCC3151560.1 hypothetical protein [Hymenobacter sp. BT770]MDO3413863.1 hypothetical protein [Hymenobacter sp. BT770]
MLKRNWHYLLLLFLLADLGHSFWQYLQFPLDGDLAPIVWPDEAYRRVLHDPFGLRVLLHHEHYSAPNRFFTHFFLYEYFRHVPLWLQQLLSPVDSLYVACALLKIAVHALVVYVLAVAISNSRHLLSRRFLLAAALVAPLLQTGGYNYQMGVVDWSITYVAFYALPLSLLLLFFLPYLRAAVHGTPLQVSWAGYAGLIGLAVVLAFNGPTVPATVLLVCPVALLGCWYRAFAARPALEPVLNRAVRALAQLPPALLVPFGLFSALSLYSMFIGLNNSESQWASMPLAERYARLPLGIYYELTEDVGLPVLLGLLLLNAFLLRRQAVPSGRVLAVLKWLGWFAVAYLLLLPLGGYRSYREYIVRHDSILPITLGLIGGFALSAYFLLTHLPTPARRRYAAAVVACLALFTFADLRKLGTSNDCERSLFAQLSKSPDPIVRLPATCTMLDWQPLTDYHKSELDGKMLQYWNITKTSKRYYQQ